MIFYTDDDLFELKDHVLLFCFTFFTSEFLQQIRVVMRNKIIKVNKENEKTLRTFAFVAKVGRKEFGISHQKQLVDFILKKNEKT